MRNLYCLKIPKFFILLCAIIVMPMHIYAQAPTTPPTNLSTSGIDGNRFTVNFTRGDGGNRIIIAKANSPVTAVPVEGTDYLAGAFGLGNEIAPGEFVVYKGSYFNSAITGLNHSTTYHFKVFEFNGTDFSTQYLTSSYLEGNQTTLTNPTTQASDITFSNVLGSTMTVNWTNGNGSGRILIARANNAVNVEPQNLVNYPGAGGGYGSSSYQIGTGNYVLSAGNASSVNISNLDPNTTYHFALYEYNGSNGRVYLTATSATNATPGTRASQATNAYPTLNTKLMEFGSFDGNSFYFRIPSSQIGNGEKRMVIIKQGSPVTAVPVDGNEYTANTTFGNGHEIAPGEFVISSGSGWVNSRTIYGLQPRTTYHFKVYEFNGSGTSTFYLKTNDSNNDPALEASQSTTTHPTTQASNITFSDVLGSNMRVNWTNGNGSGRILIARANAPVNVEPQDLINYNATTGGYGSPSYQIGTGNYALYAGNATSTNISNLDPNTTYHFALYEYNGNSGKLYLTSTSITSPAPGAIANQATNAYPTANTKLMEFGSFDGNSFYFRIPSNQIGNGEKRMVIIKQGSPVTAVPVDGTEYTANTTFGNGFEIAPGEFVISSGSGWVNNRTIYGLQPRTTYHFKVYEFNGSGSESFYLTTDDSNAAPILEASATTATHPTTQASNITFSDVLGSNMRVNWTNGNGSGRILIARANEPVNVEPQDLINYTTTAGGYGSPSYQIGTGNYALYTGNGTGVNISNLAPNTTYHFALYEYNGNSGKLYLTSTSITGPAPGAIANQATNADPTLNTKLMEFGSFDGNGFYFRIPSNQIGNGQKRMVIIKQGSPVTAVPVDGNEYTASTIFGNGHEIAPGEFVIASASGWINNRNISGLQPHTTYHFKVYEFNGSGPNAYYLVTNDADNVPVYEASQATISYPTVQAAGIFVNSKTTKSFNINWTRGNGSNRILIARANEPVNVEPQDLVNYSASNNGFGNSSYQIGTGNYVLYAGSGISANVTNLQPGTNYHFALFEYNGSSGKAYLRPGYTFEAETFGERPTTQVSNVNFSDVGATSMGVKFTRGNGSSRLVLARKDAAVNVQPSDNTTYLANAVFGQGQQIGSNNFVVFNGTNEEFQLSGLDQSSNYHFAFFEYAINQNNESYLIPGITASQATPNPPTTTASNFNYTRPCDSDLILNWTVGNGQGRLVIISEAPLNTAPTNGTNYNANFGYGLGDALGNGYVIYNAAGNLVPPNLLQASTNYYVNIFEYNGTKVDPIFNTTPLQGFIGDITAPNIICRDIQVILDASGNATITTADIATIPSGDCGTITSTIDISSFDCSNIGLNTVTLTTTDSDNNTHSCVSIVTVVDQTAPAVITKNISIQLDANGNATIAQDAVNNDSADACGPLTFTTDKTTFNSSNLGENTVILTVTDGSNNSSSATAVVTVMDLEAPVNDALCDAISLTIGATSAGNAYTNMGATAQANEPNGSCWNGISNPQTVWFKFVAPTSGNVTLTTNISGGTLANTHIAIYEAPTNCSDLNSLGNEVGCSEDVSANNYLSTAALIGLTSGNTYYVQVDGHTANTGTFGLEVKDDGCLTPTNLSVDDVAANAADISWTPGQNETNWIVKYSAIRGFNPETQGSSLSVNGLPSTNLAGLLTPNTTYQLYIKADCGNGNESDFVGPIEFTTLCLSAPTLTFLGTGEFQNSIVTPTQGTPETSYQFAVIYTNEDGAMPPYGFPRVVLDYEGNGRFTDTNDRALILYPADENDHNTVDGKVYIGSISQLPSGTNWQARVQAQTDGCATEMGPFNVPRVLTGADLEIFANDIVFDNPNPEVSSPLQITATIHNKSDFAAENFVVHLENQFDTTAVYTNITVDHLGPQESTSVVWNIITPAIPSWNPMEVFVDYTNVIAETNELNNRAIRPFTNGDFNIPGAINIIASASPSVVSLPSSTSRISVSGYAYYTDTAVQLQDSTVAGATVSFTNPVTGNRVQTHTNSRGYFSFSTPSGSQPGIYTAPVEITDFTLSAEAPVTWELIQGPCLPDLTARINPSSQSILVGDSASGTIVVTNRGCAAVEVETLLEMNQTGGLPLITDMMVPPLAPGESFSYDFTVEFAVVGTYYITGLADAGFVVVESSENNNLGTATIRVNPRIADITPSGSGRLSSRYLCTASNTTSFGIKNIGHIATGAFNNTIDVYHEGIYERSFTDLPIININAGATSSVSIAFEYTKIGRYSFELNCDVPDIVLEISETNNISNYYMDILECMPDLYVSASCEGLVVDPIDPTIPGTVTYSAQVGNSGNAPATGPVEFQFTLSNGQVYNLVHNDDILPGQQVTFSTQAPSVSSGLGVTLTATVDPNSLKADTNRSNNSVSDTLCWEFEPVPLCGYDFWNTIYHENESAQLAVGLNVKHLYRASEVKVRFEVSGPGINGWALLGDASVENVNRCPSCPYRAALPTRFVFNESGVYTFRMTSDPDNDYEECDEGNNVLLKEVTVANQPDMRILSQYINPTLLNPEPGQFIFLDISYENIGYSNIQDRMDLTVLINDAPHAVVTNVPGLIKNRTGTIAVPIPYSSEIEGLHVARAIIDSNQDVNDRNRSNNEATRSFVVGAAANLSFNTFSASNETPEIGETITLDALIANNGELDVDAEILFSYISATGDTIAIGTRPIKVLIGDDPQTSPRPSGLNYRPHGGSVGRETVSIPWKVLESPVTILGEIINSSELEFDYNDNFATTQLNTYNVSIVSTLACEGQNMGMGTLTVTAINGTAPYTYHWSNGFMGNVLEAKAGTYSVTVIDATGKRAVAAGTIEEDASCIVPTCTLSAVSFDVPTSCNPSTGAYTTTVVVAYENAPTLGFITVNGTNHPITGSPQSFEVDFYTGPVVFDISFTENLDCNLMIPIGITLTTCAEDCDGVYGGSALPGTTCLDANGDPGILDENCFCDPDATAVLDNDDLCDAIQLTLGATSTGNQYSNVGATVQTNEPSGSCWSDSSNLQTVWFSFEAPTSGNVTFNTAISGGTLSRTQMAIYEAPTNCNALATLDNEIYCDEDDDSVKALTGLTAGTIYYVQVAGMNSQTGTFGIEIKEGTLSVDAPKMDYGIQLYPNPTQSGAVFYVAAGQFKGHSVKLRITDVLGKTIYRTTTQFEERQVAVQPTSPLESGVYFVHLEQGGRTVNKRLLVK